MGANVVGAVLIVGRSTVVWLCCDRAVNASMDPLMGEPDGTHSQRESLLESGSLVLDTEF